MAERTHIPTSPACGQWETLLAEALDGLLRPEDEAEFSGHMAGCKSCSALFEEARRGREWLDFLSAEPEVPEGLLERLLAQTGPGQTQGAGIVSVDNLVAATPGGIPLKGTPAWQKPGFMGQLRRFAEPRLMMTAAMAFFSIALTLNLTGVKLSQLHMADLKPSTIRSLVQRRVTMASTPIVRYYDHLRLVYEVQSRVREMRRSTESEEAPQKDRQTLPGESKQKAPGATNKDGGSRVDPPQQSVTPANINPDLLEAALDTRSLAEAKLPRHTEVVKTTFFTEHRLAHSGGSRDETGKAKNERGTVWIASIMAV